MEIRNESLILQHCIPAHECTIFVTSSKRTDTQPAYNLRMTISVPACPEETYIAPAQSATIYLDAIQVDALIADLQSHLPRMWRKP